MTFGFAPPTMLMRPAIGDLDQLIEPLTTAEKRVALALCSLEPGWTVYVKPRLGLDRPDFLAFHDVHGMCIKPAEVAGI